MWPSFRGILCDRRLHDGRIRHGPAEGPHKEVSRQVQWNAHTVQLQQLDEVYIVWEDNCCSMLSQPFVPVFPATFPGWYFLKSHHLQLPGQCVQSIELLEQWQEERPVQLLLHHQDPGQVLLRGLPFPSCCLDGQISCHWQLQPSLPEHL